MQITSNGFVPEGKIPKEFTCDGENKMPDVRVSDVSLSAKSLVLIIDDPDVPSGLWTHFIGFNLKVMPNVSEYLLSNFPKTGTTSDGTSGYHGPCPPSGTHRYYFRVFALDSVLNLPNGSSREALEQTMQNHVLDQTEMFGMYSRNQY